jgi:Domain of unknown function (DUF5979)
MLRRFASVMAGGALALASYSVMVAAPASAGEATKNEVEVTKVVEGTSKGAGFEIVVTCPTKNFTATRTLTFPPEGGTQSAKNLPHDSTCTTVETHDGGASNVTVSGDNPCVFPEQDAKEALPIDGVGKTCHVTVTNTFVPEVEEAGPAGPQGPPGPPGESAVAATAVVSTARFTG